ncbi:DNA cytosine methyltransferase [Thermococcus sp. LS2]|uniref:DNA cytosine methyltransferase n=1 Tax=Thermococcus sp. LS2 TaxID=1638260 RepID=UPI00143BA29B|nr:DNA cytosine methyltransferase [Thermococcus sp. LS2]NJE12201.1 DNA cytosine methyltransferase [Thermococcus sp. LS2]
MKRIALMLIGLLLLSTAPVVKSISVPEYAGLSLIELGLKDSVVFGNYEIKFADVDPYWTKAALDIYENGVKKATAVLGLGDSYYYPSSTNTLLKLTLKWARSDKKTILVAIESPLVKIALDEKLNEGEAYALPSGFPSIKIKLVDAYDTSAKFTVYLPYTTITKTVNENDGFGITYQLTDDVSYYPYVFVVLKSSVNNEYATVDIYVPKYAATTLKIKRATTEETTTTETTLEPTELVYNDILYVGEILTINYNSTVYKLRLNSIGYYSSLSLFNENNTPLETFRVKEGGSYTSKKAPIRIEIPPNSVDLVYNRTYIKIYAPSGAEVLPIVREAKIKVDLSTNVKEMLLNGEELIVFVNVENQGRGKAFDVNVIAPLPNNFELKSGIGTWSLKTLDAFTKMPVLVYTLKPTQVGKYDLGKVKVEYYNEAGQKKVVTSNEVRGIVVYSIPEISLSAEAFNGTWSTYVTTQEKSVKLRFKISAGKGNPEFEFIKNATLELILPDSIDGETTIKLGDIKAGEEKIVEGQYVILKQAVSIIGAKLKYQDPLGNWHEKYFGNLLIVNSIPPKVIVEEKVQKVYPKPEELPDYIKKTLDSLNNPTPLAQAIENVTVNYLPKKLDYKTPLIVILLILVVALGAATVNYKNKYEIVKSKLERRKKRPGGLPKKEEEEQEVKTPEVEKEEVL